MPGKERAGYGSSGDCSGQDEKGDLRLLFSLAFFLTMNRIEKVLQ